MFDHVNKMLKYYGIKVVKWRTTSSGSAYNTLPKRVEIPKPTDVDRFCVCMHEIKHIIDMHDAKRRDKRYIEEFRCDQFAALHCKMIGIPQEEIDKWNARTRIHTLVQLAKAFNRGMKISSIPKDMAEFLQWDFSKWKEGHNVYLWRDKSGIILQKVTKRYSVAELNNVLNKYGYNIQYVRENMPTPYLVKRENHLNFEYDYEGIVDLMLLKQAEVLMETHATNEEKLLLKQIKERSTAGMAEGENESAYRDRLNADWSEYKKIENKYKKIAAATSN